MAILNVSCSKKTDKDTTQIIARNNELVSLTNGKEGCKISLDGFFLDVNNTSCHTVTVPKNESLTVTFKDVFDGESSNGKFICIKSENKMNVEKKYENDKLYISFANSNIISLGKLFVISGTDLNPISATFHIYNGTPETGNLANITGATYDSTLNFLIGY